MHIIFKTIHYENFLSSGSDGVTVNFIANKTTLITGRNGSGKSSWIDALCYAIFNKPLRAVNLPLLVNSINAKKMIVELEFSIGTNEYKIRRGAKPAVFEIFKNGDLIPQDAANGDYQAYLERNIIGLNYKTFIQLVVIGKSNYTPFMKMGAAARRDRIEDFLDLTVFSAMADLNKKQIAESKTVIKDIETEYAIHKNKIDVQESYVKTLSDDHTRKIEENQSAIATAFTKIDALEKEISAHNAEIEKYAETIQDKASVENKYETLEDLISKLKTNYRQLVSELKFFDENDNCPTCKQPISEHFTNEICAEKTSKKDELTVALEKMDTKYRELEYRLTVIAQVQFNIREIESKIRDLNSEISTEQRYLTKLQRELSETSTVGSNLDAEKAKLRDFASAAIEIINRKSEALTEQQYVTMCQKLLKDDAIKATVVKQFVPIINKLLSIFLDKLEFFVSFALDESFNETILSRDRDMFTYELFSIGEQSRIDLALLFTWITITGLKSTVSTNLLVVDEMFDNGVDTETSSIIVDILQDEFPDKNIFVISHYPNLYERLENHIKFEKRGNYSVML